MELYSSDDYDRAKAEALLVGYDARWAAEAARFEVLAVEARFTAPLVNPRTGAASRTWRLGGKLDALVRERGGARRVLVVEHKTASEDVSPGSDYWKRLRLDGQVSLYFVGAEHVDGGPRLRADGCLYDVIRKPTIKPARATPADKRKHKADGTLYASQRERDETPDEYRARLMEAIAAAPADYFTRGEVVRLESEIDDALFDVWMIGQQLREAERFGRFPRNPDACVRYGRTCEYFGVCTGEASLLDPALFRKLSTVHPELAEGEALADPARILSSSRLKDARACQRLHRYKYRDGFRPARDADALRFGSLVHLGLEAWWRTTPGWDRLEAALAALRGSPNGGEWLAWSPLGAEARASVALDHDPNFGTHSVGDGCPGGHEERIAA